jgi:glycosyltransferase involved in cell wall biosynthesis
VPPGIIDAMVRDPAEPVRLLVVSPYATLGGAEWWLLRLLGATTRIRADVVVLQEGPFVDELRRREIPVTVRPVGRRPIDLVDPTLWLAREIRRRRPDVVLGNGVKAQLVAAPACWLAGAPVVWAKHDHSYDRWLARPLGRVSDAVIAAVEELGEPVGRSDVVILPPPRPPRAPADRAEARQFFARRGVALDDRPVLAMATRLVPYKGVDDAIVALSRPAAEQWTLAVLGDDDASSPGEQQRLAALARDLGVDDRVHWLGTVPDAGHWLAAFDALAVLTKPVGPRDPGKEGFGTAAFEAMLAGVPVIGVGGGAVTRRLDGRAGIAVDPADPDAVAAALARLADAGVNASAGTAARELVADHPDESTVADGLASVLAMACGRPGAGVTAADGVSVVVPVFDEGEAVDGIVHQLLDQLGPDDEIVVVDDGSRDDTGDRAQRLADGAPDRIRVVRRERNGGVGAARNSGVSAARCELLAFTDAGCALSPVWLSALRQAFAERPRPDFVAGVYHVSSARILDTAMAVSCYPDVAEVRRPDWLVRLYGRLFGRVFSSERPAGRSFAVTKNACVAIGGFREDMAATEDVDFSTSMARSGRRCVLAADADLEWLQADLPGSARMYARYGRGDATSGDPAAVSRDIARAVAYVAAPALFARGGRTVRAVVLLGAASYLSLPWRRALHRPRGAAVAAAVPLTVAVKDVAKVIGFTRGLSQRRRAS